MEPVTATLMGFSVDAGAGVTWTRTLGIDPDINTVPIAWTEEAIPTTPGDLVLSDGTTTVTIRNVKIDSHTNRRTESGNWIDCVVRDRRWAWAYGHITGEYNPQDSDGYITAEKSARELAALCLDAMGETGYDVSALPADLYPPVEWHFANPARELQKICDDLGCAVALLLDDTVKVVRLGEGAAWPSGAAEEDAPGEKMTRRAAKYTVCGGRHVVQMTARLLPVGRDTDGAVRPLPALSYAPDASDPYGGFGISDGSVNYQAPFFNSLGDGSYGLVLTPAQKAASESVFRLWVIPGSYRHLLPVLPEIVDTETVQDGVDGSVERRRRPYLFDNTESIVPDPETGLAVEGELEDSEWEIDSESGLVKLTAPRWRVDGSGRQLPSELDLTFAVRWRGENGLSDGDFYSYSEGSGELETVIHRPELVAYGVWDGSAVAWRNVDGSRSLDEFAAAAISQADPGADWFTSRTGTFPGVLETDLDGRFRQVSIHVGADGASTSLQWNMEFPRPGAPSYAEKVRRLETARSSRKVERLSAEDSYGRTSSRAAGVSLPARAVDGGEWRWMINASQHHCPRGGVVQLGGVTPQGHPSFGRPVTWCLLNVGVAGEAIPPGKGGRVYIEGSHVCRILNYDCIIPGMLLTTVPNAFHLGFYASDSWDSWADIRWAPRWGCVRVLRRIGPYEVIGEILRGEYKPMASARNNRANAQGGTMKARPLEHLRIGKGFSVLPSAKSPSYIAIRNA